MKSFTKTDFDAYMGTLNDVVWPMQKLAADIVLVSRDTLSEEFQLAAAVCKVFEDRARAWWEARQ